MDDRQPDKAKRRALRLAPIVAGIVWVALGLSSVVAWWFSDVSLTEMPRRLADWLDAVGLAPAVAIFLILYAARPLVLFPSTIMGIASGITFGPIIGSVVTLIGELLGAGLAFSLARLLGRRWIRDHEWELLARWDERMSENGLLTVCLMRLLSIPFDSVSYACGLTGIGLRDFLLGTMLGGTFYILTVTLLGGSAAAGLDGEAAFAGLTLSHRWLALILSGTSFALGVAIAWLLRRRYLGSPKIDE